MNVQKMDVKCSTVHSTEQQHTQYTLGIIYISHKDKIENLDASKIHLLVFMLSSLEFFVLIIEVLTRVIESESLIPINNCINTK